MQAQLPMPFVNLLPLWAVAREDTPFAKLLRPPGASQLDLDGLHAMPVVRPSALDSVALPGRFAMLRLKPPVLPHLHFPLLRKHVKWTVLGALPNSIVLN